MIAFTVICVTIIILLMFAPYVINQYNLAWRRANKNLVHLYDTAKTKVAFRHKALLMLIAFITFWATIIVLVVGWIIYLIEKT